MRSAIEDRLVSEAGKSYPICAGGNGGCPPEDCGGADAFLEHCDDILSLDSRDDLTTMAEIIGDITRERGLETLDDAEVGWRLERSIEGSQARERAQGKAFSRRAVGHVAVNDRTAERGESICYAYR